MRRTFAQFAEWLATPDGRQRSRDTGFFALLFVAVAAAYSPSLRHPPRADQWCFLADTFEDLTFHDSLCRTYSYNRTREFLAGDSTLFRPVLFALLSAEKWAFGGNLAQTQGFGIVLHGVICVVLLALARQVARLVRGPEAEPGGERLAYATVAFFALNPCVQELVIWSHLHGYLLFLLLVLSSALCLLRAAERVQASRPAGRLLWAAWWLTLVAAFTYELGQVYASLAGCAAALAILPQVGRRRATALFIAFAAIGVVYQTVNRIDREVHSGRYKLDGAEPDLIREALEPATLTHSARYVLFTTVQPFFPSVLVPTYADQRLYLAESLWYRHRMRTLTPVLLLSYGAAVLALILGVAGAWRLVRARTRLPLLPLLLFGALYVAYAGVIVLGRMNLRPYEWVLTGNSYYTYTALAFALVAFSTTWHAAGGWAVSARYALAVALLLLCVPMAEQVRESNELVARETREWSQAIRVVQKFVDAHASEPGFGFQIDDNTSDEVPRIYGHTIIDLMFARWVSVPRPRYTLALRKGEVCIVWTDSR